MSLQENLSPKYERRGLAICLQDINSRTDKGDIERILLAMEDFKRRDEKGTPCESKLKSWASTGVR